MRDVCISWSQHGFIYCSEERGSMGIGWFESTLAAWVGRNTKMAGRTSHGTTQDQASLRSERNVCTKHEILRYATSNSFKSALWFIRHVECELLWHSETHRIATKTKQKNKLHGLSPRANYTDRATAAWRRSDCQLLRINDATWSAWRILTAVFSVF
jgi:hypothetical protein